MTIGELIEKTIFCDYLDVTIRENGEGKWIYQYCVGENAQNCKYDDVLINGKWVRTEKNLYFKEPTEFRKPNGLLGKIIPKKPEKAPKEVLELEINEFQAMTVFSERNRWGIFATAYPKGWTKPEPEQKPTNQMTLF